MASLAISHGNMAWVIYVGLQGVIVGNTVGNLSPFGNMTTNNEGTMIQSLITPEGPHFNM